MAAAKQKTNKRAQRVWDGLIQRYGTRFVDSYGIDIPKPWIDATEDLTDEQIKHGLKTLLKISPIHPPTLGQFIDASMSMPVEQIRQSATIQEQLCEYAAHELRTLCSAIATPQQRIDYCRPWTYVYREWWDATRPKGMERCAECVGIVIELTDGSKVGWSVAMMQADTEGYQRMLKRFEKRDSSAA